MAFTSTVTKQSVEQLNSNDYQIKIHVVIQEDAVTILEKDYSERYYDQTVIGDIRTALQNQIKADWDQYVAQKSIYDSTAFNNMVGQIETSLDTYINT